MKETGSLQDNSGPVLSSKFVQKTTLKTGRKVDNGISLNSMFSIAMYFFGLVWTETCNFGSAILVGSALIVLGYLA